MIGNLFLWEIVSIGCNIAVCYLHNFLLYCRNSILFIASCRKMKLNRPKYTVIVPANSNYSEFKQTNLQFYIRKFIEDQLCPKQTISLIISLVWCLQCIFGSNFGSILVYIQIFNSCRVLYHHTSKMVKPILGPEIKENAVKMPKRFSFSRYNFENYKI